MNALTVPRAVVALEYKALRYPSHLLSTKVVATRLPEESGFRLAYERFLGALDSKAGALLDDQDLLDRGRALSRRADVIEKAVVLEAKAEARKAEADAKLRSTAKKVQDRKTEARETHLDDVAQAEADKREAKAEAARKAAQRKSAEREAVAAKAQHAIEAEKERARQQEARIEQQTEARTAAPKAQLSDAVEDSKAARKRKDDAEELARLAEQEKLSRKG